MRYLETQIFMDRLIFIRNHFEISKFITSVILVTNLVLRCMITLLHAFPFETADIITRDLPSDKKIKPSMITLHHGFPFGTSLVNLK